MDCAEETSLLRRELSRHRGVFDLEFDTLQARMNVEFEDTMTTAAAIREAVSRAGMRAEDWAPPAGALPETFWQRHGRTAMAAASAAALGAAMLAEGLRSGNFWAALLAHGGHGADGEHPLSLMALYGAAILAGLWFCLPKAWASLRHRRADMNVLVVLSVAGAVYLEQFSEAATVSFLFSLASLMETWSMARVRHAVAALLKVAPTTALVKHGNHTHAVPVASVPVGATIVVKPGERIPCDGEIVSGRSTVNQALLTGESVPVPKRTGDKVFAGTMNGGGALDIVTTRPYADTTMARILRMVSDSEQRRAPMEQWVERFARVYTPAVILLAMLVATVPPLTGAGAWQQWFYQGMVILLISCPCALVISTPVSIVAALTSAAGCGVLIKGGAFLEAAARVRAVAFDKTGVLTRGQPELKTLKPVGGCSEEEALRRMAGLEERSEHPLARAIVRLARDRRLDVPQATAVEALPGKGARGEIGGELFWIGSGLLLVEQGLDCPEIRGSLREIEEHDQTLVACGSDRQVYALLGLNDQVRPEAREAVEALKRLGVEKVAMLTGDSPRIARRVAEETGLDAVHPQLLPEEKAGQIREYQRRYGMAAMVGDGINDTPAMAAASLGIALGSKGTDAALETADIVLMSDNLRLLPFVIAHARRTLRVIQQNVAFAVLTKLVFLGLAAAGAATLWMAIAADMGATLAVTFNGLRLLRADKEKLT